MPRGPFETADEMIQRCSGGKMKIQPNRGDS